MKKNGFDFATNEFQPSNNWIKIHGGCMFRMKDRRKHKKKKFEMPFNK